MQSGVGLRLWKARLIHKQFSSALTYERRELRVIFQDVSECVDPEAEASHFPILPKYLIRLADDAVDRKPVSAPNSQLTGKITGKFAETALPVVIDRSNLQAN